MLCDTDCVHSRRCTKYAWGGCNGKKVKRVRGGCNWMKGNSRTVRVDAMGRMVGGGEKVEGGGGEG